VTEAWERRKDCKERRCVCVRVIDEIGEATWIEGCAVEECTNAVMLVACDNGEHHELNATTLECTSHWCVLGWMWKSQMEHRYVATTATTDSEDSDNSTEPSDDDYVE
jgi:hypothetical protein